MTSKELVASYTYELIKGRFHKDFILGIGTGSPENCFIEISNQEKTECNELITRAEARRDRLKTEGDEFTE